MPVERVRTLVDRYTDGRIVGRARRARRQRARPQPGPRPGRGPGLGRRGRPGTTAHLPRRRARRRQDLRHARRGLAASASAAPTSWSASSSPTGGPAPSPSCATSRSCPAARSSTAARRSRRWTSMPCCPPPRGRPGRRAGPLQHPRQPQRQALAGHRRAARRGHRRDLDREHPAPRVSQRRRPADHRRHPARDRARRRGPPGRPGRAGRHGSRGAAPAHAARQHLRPREGRRRARPTTSGRATSPPCASSPCCGWPTRSTRPSPTTAPATGSPSRGRPASGWPSPSPARPAPSDSSAAPPAWPTAPRRSWSASTSRAPTGSWPSPARPLDAHRRLLTDLGGRYREVVDNDVGRALVRTALSENATQLLIGASRRSRWSELVRGSVVNRIAQQAGAGLDVHIISTAPHGATRSGARAG